MALTKQAAKFAREHAASCWRAALRLLPPRLHVMADYFRVYRRFPNLEHPSTFSEKIVARKLFDRDPRLPDMVDKIKVKEIIAAKFGERLVIPTLGVWGSAEALNFNKPPLSNTPYVLKTNHASGTNLFVKAGDLARPEKLRKKMAAFLCIDHAAIAREWAYSAVVPKIFAEPYIETPEGYLADYKFHVFSGKVYATEVVMDRFHNYGVSFYDRSWQPLDVGYLGRYPRYKGLIQIPTRYKDMLTLAEAIGADFPYVRVDLYLANNEIKFGEVTFYPGAGHDRFSSPEWDEKFGLLWK